MEMITPEKKIDNDQMKLLNEAFLAFNSATQELQQSYDKLKGKVEELNIELEETNRKLKKNLKEKEELKEYLQNVLENAPNGVVVIDNKMKVKNFNKAAEQITGVNSEEARGLVIKNIFPDLKREEKKEWKRYIDNYEIIKKDGEKKILNIYISDLKDRKKRKIGKIIALEDITNFKRLEEQIQRKNRLEAMGEMAAGISHEIRNPLGAIELFASILKKDIKGDGEKEELVDNIVSGVKSLTNITSNLLLFTKDVKIKKEVISIKDVVDDSLKFVEHAALNKDIKLRKTIKKNLSRIHADHDLLKQVFLNLVLNAVQAVKMSGEIKICARNLGKEEPESINSGKKYVQIIIEDTGPGIKRENIEKIFNPFFTTKRSGLGLGLAIVHKIITSHDGIVEVKSKEGAGTKFSIMLPIQETDVSRET